MILPRPLALAALLLLPNAPTYAQWEAEADPFAYAVSGFSAHLAHVFDAPRVRLQMGVFGADVPEWLHGEDDFDLRVRGVTLKADFFPWRAGAGFFVGLDADYSRLRYRVQETRDARERNVAGVGPRVGYRFELGRRFYVTPWISVRYLLDADDVIVSGRRFEQKSYAVFPTAHLGWRF